MTPCTTTPSIATPAAAAAATAAAGPLRHLHALCARRSELAPLADELFAVFVLLRDAFQAGGGLLLCGNGGSAADADHWAGELLKGFESRRPLTQAERQGLDPLIAARLQRGLPAIPLTGFPALRSAVANDIDPQLEFAQLVMALARPHWVLVGLSTSGEAANVCAAAQVARARGLKVVSLTGAGGGRLADLSDLCLRMPSGRTCEVQELHLPVYHTLCLMLEDALTGANA